MPRECHPQAGGELLAARAGGAAGSLWVASEVAEQVRTQAGESVGTVDARGLSARFAQPCCENGQADAGVGIGEEDAFQVARALSPHVAFARERAKRAVVG